MSGVIIRSDKDLLMYAAGKRAGLNAVATAFEALMDQLAAARADNDAMLQRLKTETEAEVAALRSELNEAYALMERYKVLSKVFNEFACYERSEQDTVN